MYYKTKKSSWLRYLHTYFIHNIRDVSIIDDGMIYNLCKTKISNRIVYQKLLLYCAWNMCEKSGMRRTFGSYRYTYNHSIAHRIEKNPPFSIDPSPFTGSLLYWRNPGWFCVPLHILVTLIKILQEDYYKSRLCPDIEINKI